MVKLPQICDTQVNSFVPQMTFSSVFNIDIQNFITFEFERKLGDRIKLNDFFFFFYEMSIITLYIFRNPLKIKVITIMLL
jgi:hypothetical protein